MKLQIIPIVVSALIFLACMFPALEGNWTAVGGMILSGAVLAGLTIEAAK